MLVDEGMLQWDDPVTKHLPHFQVYDEWVTGEVTIRDLLSHRMGVERGDFLWFSTGYTRDEIVRHVRYLRPVAGFRAQYGYSNNMYITAGELIAAVTGISWDAFIRHRIFEPLGMRSSNTSVWELAGVANRAMGHEELNGVRQPVPYRSRDNEAPGGPINSNVLDMRRRARLQRAGGTVQGRRLRSPAPRRGQGVHGGGGHAQRVQPAPTAGRGPRRHRRPLAPAFAPVSVLPPRAGLAPASTASEPRRLRLASGSGPPGRALEAAAPG